MFLGSLFFYSQLTCNLALTALLGDVLLSVFLLFFFKQTGLMQQLCPHELSAPTPLFPKEIS